MYLRTMEAAFRIGSLWSELRIFQTCSLSTAILSFSSSDTVPSDCMETYSTEVRV